MHDAPKSFIMGDVGIKQADSQLKASLELWGTPDRAAFLERGHTRSHRVHSDLVHGSVGGMACC